MERHQETMWWVSIDHAIRNSTLFEFLEKDDKTRWKNLDYNGLSLLHYACRHTCLKSIQLLVNHGLDLNRRDIYNLETPAHEACRVNNSGGLKILIEAGANMELINNCLYTPLGFAKIYAAHDCVSLLESSGHTHTWHSSSRF